MKLSEAAEVYDTTHLDGCKCPCTCKHRGWCQWCATMKEKHHERRMKEEVVEVLIEGLKTLVKTGCKSGCGKVAKAALVEYKELTK